MRFNGKDPRDVHKSISVSREIPPGMANRKLRTIATPWGEIVTGVEMEGGRYTVILNIAARSLNEALTVRTLIAKWAASSGSATARLYPTHNLERFYNAIVESISEPEFGRGFYTVDVVFFLPRPVAVAFDGNSTNAYGSIVPINVSSNVPARPKITHTMSAENGEFVITLDEKPVLRVIGAYAAGQVIEMDMEREIVTVDGVSAMDQVDPQSTRWDSIAPGEHLMELSDPGRTEVRWYSEWL